MRSIIRFLTVVLVLASIVSIIGCSSDSKEGATNNPAAVQMMRMLPANLSGFSYMDINEMRADDYGASVLEYLNSEANMDFSEQVNGFGMASSDVESEYSFLYEGNYSPSQMMDDSIGSYNYGGFSIWTFDEYNNSVAMIDNISVYGRDSIIERCIDAVNGNADSMYDNAKDVVDRLPAGFELYVYVVNSGAAPEGFTGLLVQGVSVTKQGGSNVGTSVYKFNSTETAQHCTECSNIFYNQDDFFLPNANIIDVNIGGVFVTVVTTSIIPVLDAGQYNSLCFQAAGEGNMSQVIYYCSKSIELNPNYALVYSYRGMAYSFLGDYDKALADYDQYIMLYPDDAFGYYKRGALYQSFGHETEAIANFNKCLLLNPDESIKQLAETALQELGVTP